jgi:hypothetical protein
VSFVSTPSDLSFYDKHQVHSGRRANEIVRRLSAASEESGHGRVQGRIDVCLRILTCLDIGFRGTVRKYQVCLLV